MSPHEKTSWPAATGVWVVNTVAAATCSSAAANDAPSRILRSAPLDDLKRRVTLVQMPDGWLDAERLQRAHAADTEHDLLHDARRFVAAVEAMRDRSVSLVIVREDRCRADSTVVWPARPRQMRRSTFAVADRNGYTNFPALGVDRERERQIFDTRRGVLLDLATARVDVLFEKSLVIEQTHRDERQREIRCRLTVIGRQNAESARIERQAFVKPELETEVRD